MNIEELLKKIWPQWKVGKVLGQGSFGTVYEIERQDIGGNFKAALKCMSIPKTEKEFNDALSDGMDKETATTYFRSIMEDLVKEFSMMEQLKGFTNIVSYEDHAVIEHENGMGWDILIRMELLTPLNEYIRDHKLTENDIVKLAIDICSALVVCEKKRIVHRDIKPENVFVSEYGDYELGDFGVARTVEKTTSGMSIKGTITYMAPEVYKGSKYNANVDIYSLGIMLYKLANGGRTPFLPPAPTPITYTDKENAERRRMGGEPLPVINGISENLMAIIAKAAAYESGARYLSAEQMKDDLMCLLPQKNHTPIALTNVEKASGVLERSVSSSVNNGEEATVSILEASGQNSMDEDATVSAAETPARQSVQTSVSSQQAVQNPVQPRDPQTNQPASAKKSKIGPIIGIAGGAVALIAIIIIVVVNVSRPGQSSGYTTNSGSGSSTSSISTGSSTSTAESPSTEDSSLTGSDSSTDDSSSTDSNTSAGNTSSDGSNIDSSNTNIYTYNDMTFEIVDNFAAIRKNKKILNNGEYHAFVVFQNVYGSGEFRNEPYGAYDGYGIDTDEFWQVSRSDDAFGAHGTINDVVIDGSNVYMASITDMDIAMLSEGGFTKLMLCTDIPISVSCEISIMSVKINNKATDARVLQYSDYDGYWSIVFDNYWYPDGYTERNMTYPHIQAEAPVYSIEIMFSIDF